MICTVKLGEQSAEFGSFSFFFNPCFFKYFWISVHVGGGAVKSGLQQARRRRKFFRIMHPFLKAKCIILGV